MNLLLVLPLLLPLAGAAVCLLLWSRPRLQAWLTVAVLVAMLGVSVALLHLVSDRGIQASAMGGWPAPFGISIVADLFSALMLVLASIIGLAGAVYSLAAIDRERARFGYFSLYQVLMMGISGAFLTGDIFNLFVWFEVMLIASFVLMALGSEPLQIEGALKYVTINLLASALFLTAVGILYGETGTLNFAALSQLIESGIEPGLTSVVAMLFLACFGIKAAIFPLFFWLPASYHTPPVVISAVFAGLLTKVGVYALVRTFTQLFVHDVGLTHNLILVLSGLTMVTGVLGAVAQQEVRRILSFHIISQIGYMTMGLGLFTPLALAGSIFYITHHIIVKANLFFVAGLMHNLRGTYALESLGGFSRYGLLSLLFLVPALSLAGIPPLSGFFAKLALVRAGIAAGQYEIVFVALAVGLLTLFSMMKIWTEAFWKAHSGSEPPAEARTPLAMVAPVACLASMTVLIGLAAGPLLDLSIRAAEQLLDPDLYAEAVLGRSS